VYALGGELDVGVPVIVPVIGFIDKPAGKAGETVTITESPTITGVNGVAG
jgi:hypothetical protein